MSHLETLIGEYLDWQGFLVRRNVKVGRLGHGGWEMELDIIGYHPQSGILVQYEPSLDADSWPKRETRYQKKFEAGRKYILQDIFPWLKPRTPLNQIAVFPNHSKGRDTIAGGTIVSIDELMAEIRAGVVASGIMASNAVPEQYALLRTLQLSHVGYYRTIQKGLQPAKAPSESRRSARAR